MEVPDGWASDESEVSEVSDGGLGSGFCLDHPVDHPGALTETAFARAAGRASLAGATEVEIAFDAFERVHPDALRACAGSLTHLCLMHNGLRAFPALRYVSRTLRKLELTHQRLDSTAGLADAGAMPALRELLLNDNAIARIEGMDTCPNLERLWLFSNDITRVEGLDALASLRELWLQDNDLAFDDDDDDDADGRAASGTGNRKAFAGFAPLLRVREVALAGNRRLVDLETCLAAVACLPTLESLSFRDDHFAPAPVAAQPGYRERAARKLRQLRVLDAAEVTVAERGAAADDRARARCLGDVLSEREREAHEAKVAELREARDRRLAAAAAARARARAELLAVEQATMLGRATVRAHAEEAARRREARRSVLRETLLRIGESHARVSNAILARGEAAARGESARFERERRRVRFERDAARAYEALSRESAAASVSSASSTTRANAKTPPRVPDALVEVREGSPEHAAVASNARAAARRADGRDSVSGKKDEADDVVGDARVVSVWRVVAPDAASAEAKRPATSPDVARDETAGPRGASSDGVENGDAATSGLRKRWGYVGLAPAATLRALGASGLEASVRAHRTLAEAYQAAKRALASGARANPLDERIRASAEEEELAAELDGPAALLVCEVWLTREEAALWDASSRKPTNVGFELERERIARCAFVVHAERARASDFDSYDDERDASSDADEDAKDAPSVSRCVARQVLRLTRRDVPVWFTRDDAAALRALEDAADAATREYLHDAWTALDPATGAALAAQDDELASLRGELRGVRERIAEERLAQDDIARSLRKVTFR